MKVRFVIFLFYCLYSMAVCAQQIHDIGGVVKDEYGQPIMDANVVIFDSHNGIIGQVKSLEDGSFTLKNIDMFPIIVEISHVSYDKHTLYLLDKSEISSLKEIVLVNNVRELSEVEVVASKPEMYFRDDALVVNISNNLSLQSQSLNRVLRKMPGMNIDDEGNLTLYGSKLAVYIDGIPQKTITPQILQKLIKSYPVNVIEEIEINPNSTGKYGSAPESSYINIITKSSFHDGSLISLGVDGLYYGNSTFAGGANATVLYSKGNFALNTLLSYENEYTQKRTGINTFMGNELNINQTSVSETKQNTFSGTINANYNFNNGDRITAYFNLYTDFSKYHLKETDYIYNNTEQNQIALRGFHKGNDDLWSAYFQYQTNTNNKNSFLVAYSYLFGGLRTMDNSLTKEKESTPYLKYDAKMNGGIHEITAKYSYQPDRGERFDLRVNSNYGRLTDEVLYNNEYSNINNYMVGHEFNTQINVSYLYNIDKNFSTYIDLGGKITKYDLKNQGQKIGNFNSSKFLPYFHIRYTSNSGNYRGTLAFSSGVTRPNYEYMLKGIRVVDDYNYIVGNEDIKSLTEYGLIFNQYFYKDIALSFAYMRRNNLSGAIYGFKNGLTEVAYNNYADENRFYSYLQIPFRVLDDKFSGSVTLSASLHDLKNLRNGYELSKNDCTKYWTSGFQLYTDYKLFDNLGIYANYEFYPEYETPQIKVSNRSIFNCGLYCGLLKNDKLLISIDVNDVFDTYNTKNVIYYDKVEKIVDSRTKTRYVKIGLVYNISQGKKQKNTINSLPIDVSRFGK